MKAIKSLFAVPARGLPRRLQLTGAATLALFGTLLSAAEPVRFNRDMRPIMSDTCFRCHGPDKNTRMANM
ncbi:MAG TPA: hypothetical protein VEQ63_03115, partial [Bryobacteraceae bacterium]|nr:hypothetical protein [Bryobacteraceae bacterium]